MVEMVKIEAVVFDYGNVLSKTPLEEDVSSMASVLDVSEAEFLEAYWRHRLDYDCGLTANTEYWQSVSGSLGASLDQGRIDELTNLDVISWSRPDPTMLKFVDQLVQSEIPLAILSNMPLDLKLWVEEECDWLPDFVHYTFSCDLKCAKPDERIYAHSKGGFEIHENNLAFIDDRIENVEAAKCSGMQAFHYTGLENLLTELEGSGLIDS